MGKSTWTEQMDQQLRVMRGRGQTFSVIAAALGVARSAVGGRAMRLGISLPVYATEAQRFDRAVELVAACDEIELSLERAFDAVSLPAEIGFRLWADLCENLNVGPE